jgi:hypothetical protein
MKRKITKEHRLLDDTDLNIINNTFREIKHDFNNTFKEIKHDNINNFNRIDNTFKLIEKTCESMNARADSLEKSMNIRVDSLEKSMDDKHKTLVFLISIVGIVLTALKIFY